MESRCDKQPLENVYFCGLVDSCKSMVRCTFARVHQRSDVVDIRRGVVQPASKLGIRILFQRVVFLGGILVYNLATP